MISIHALRLKWSGKSNVDLSQLSSLISCETKIKALNLTRLAIRGNYRQTKSTALEKFLRIQNERRLRLLQRGLYFEYIYIDIEQYLIQIHKT